MQWVDQNDLVNRKIENYGRTIASIIYSGLVVETRADVFWGGNIKDVNVNSGNEISVSFRELKVEMNDQLSISCHNHYIGDSI